MEDWLGATKDLVNAYTVGSFHMAENSPFYREPEKFGFELKTAMKLYCQAGFDEKDGLAWREKALQNQRSNEHIRRFIDDLKKSRKPTGTRMDDSHLLMYLYRTLGHGRKKLIGELYEAAYTVNPHIAAARRCLLEQARARSSGLNSLLRRNGIALELSGPADESLGFTLGKAGTRLACEVRARSEEILINPAEGRYHGDYFYLQASGDGPRAAELEEVIRSAGGKLTGENLSPPQAGKWAVRLQTRGGTARFTVSLSPGPPSCEILSGGFDAGLLRRVGGLLLASAAAAKLNPAAAAKALSDIRKTLPGVLKIAESWPTRG